MLAEVVNAHKSCCRNSKPSSVRSSDEQRSPRHVEQSEPIVYDYRAKLIRAVDGDTIDCEVDLGFTVFVRIRFRLAGVDTPERGQPGFHEATDELVGLLEGVSDDEGWFTVRSTKTGKYGRWLCDIDGVTDVMAAKYPYRR